MKPMTGQLRQAAVHTLVVVAGLVLAAGCATASAPAPTGTPTPTLSIEKVTPTPTAPTTAPAATAPATPLAPVGHQPGNRIPDFAMRLVDGSLVTSEGLVSQGQPTMLFFFTTW